MRLYIRLIDLICLRFYFLKTVEDVEHFLLRVNSFFLESKNNIDRFSRGVFFFWCSLNVEKLSLDDEYKQENPVFAMSDRLSLIRTNHFHKEDA